MTVGPGKAADGLARRLHHGLASIEEAYDALRHRLRDRSGRGPLTLLAYHGHGTPGDLRLRGRLLEGESLRAARLDEDVWDQIVATWKRFETDEVPGATIQAELGGRLARTETDEEGYFEFHWTAEEAIVEPDGPWVGVPLGVVPDSTRGIEETRTVGTVRVPSPEAAFGIISDIDDTVIATEATSFRRMLRATLFETVHTRLPLTGVAELYTRLVESGPADARRPMFYVSSSPWNLYDFLVELMDLHRLPSGPLFLRDLGLSRERFIKGPHSTHKGNAIAEILETHGGLDFILSGDSGQHDPEIYLDIARRYPDRILAIYIRNASAAERDEAVEGMAAAARESGLDIRFVRDSAEIAQHARDRGWLTEGDVEAVRERLEETSGLPGEADG